MSVIIRNRTNLRRWAWSVSALAGIVAIGGLTLAIGSKSVSGSKSAKTTVAKSALSSGLGNQEHFIENKGQWDPRARFAVRSPGMDTWITDSGILFDAYVRRNLPSDDSLVKVKTLKRSAQRGHVIAMDFIGANSKSKAVGSNVLEAKQNYLRTGNRAISASVFDQSRIVGIYPGIDVKAYVDGNRPRYDLIVNPGSDPRQIQMKFNGADEVTSSSGTDLRLQTSIGPINMGGLYAYQQGTNGRISVPASFRVATDGIVRFEIGTYDPSKALIIDPVVYSTLYGGVGGVDVGYDVKVDAGIHAYVVGQTDSTNFPTSIGAYDEFVVGVDGYCSKFANDGSDVVYSTVLGGNGDEAAYSVALDAAGKAYVVGISDSPNWPSAPIGPGGDFDAWLVVLNDTGTGTAMTQRWGGTLDDQATSVAIDQFTDIYVSGDTFAIDFPTVAPFQAALKGSGDAFLTKFNGGVDGAAMEYSTYLGGTDSPFPNDEDVAIDVAVDDEASPYVLISTEWNDAPKLAGSYDTTCNGQDALILKFAPDGQSLSFGTFLGGNDFDTPRGIALDSTNNVYVTGVTFSFNYPKTFGVFDTTYNLGQDSYCTKMNRLGTGLIYSTFCGFTGGASPMSIAVDDLGFAHVTGTVYQTTLTPQRLPVTPNADDPTFNGPPSAIPPGSDAFLQVLSPSATEQQYCSYFGGSMFDQGYGIGLDGARNAYIVGYTTSSAEQTIQWPTTPGAFKEAFPPDTLAPPSLPEGYLVKVKTRIPLTITSLIINPNAVAGGDPSVGTVNLSAPASTGGATVTLTNNNNSVVTTSPSFLIPAGATSGTFNIATVLSLTTTAVVAITATVEGDSKSANITVSPWLTALTLSNDTVTGGNPVGGRITIYRNAPNGGVNVNMASTVPAVASVPAIVTVPAGLNTATFDVTTTGVANPQTVDISATYLGLTRTVTLTVIPARLYSLSFIPTVVSGGTSISGIVQLDGGAPNGIGVTIALAADNPAVTVPLSVVILPQTSSIQFPATTLFVSANTSVNITAQYAGDTRTAVVDVLRANLISLTLSPDVIQGGNSTTGTVGLDAPAATGGVNIPITSSNPGVASVPASAQIPSGSTNASFQVDTTIVVVQTIVTIEATRGPATLQSNLTVNPITFTVTVDPNTVTGGLGSVGTVTLTEIAPVGGATIDISSNAPSVVTVPSSVVIPALGSTATFSITTVPVAANTTVIITAAYQTSNASANLDVLAAGVNSLTINPNSVPGGVSTTGLVTLSGVAPAGGVTVLTSSNNPAAIVSGSVTVLQGNSSATFPISTLAVPISTTATIQATANSFSESADLQIIAANLLSIKFNPSRVRGGIQTFMTIRLDAAAPPGGASITVTSSNPSIAPIPTTVVIAAGDTEETVQLVTRRVSRTLSTNVTASYNAQVVFTTLTVTR
jgi:hypothetical protein